MFLRQICTNMQALRTGPCRIPSAYQLIVRGEDVGEGEKIFPLKPHATLPQILRLKKKTWGKRKYGRKKRGAVC